MEPLLPFLFIFYWCSGLMFFSVSHRDADALVILNCTTEKKKVLFTIAQEAFSTNAPSTPVSGSTYQLVKSYLRRQTHPINAHMYPSFGHKVSVRLILLFLFCGCVKLGLLCSTSRHCRDQTSAWTCAASSRCRRALFWSVFVFMNVSSRNFIFSFNF